MTNPAPAPLAYLLAEVREERRRVDMLDALDHDTPSADDFAALDALAEQEVHDEF